MDREKQHSELSGVTHHERQPNLRRFRKVFEVVEGREQGSSPQFHAAPAPATRHEPVVERRGGDGQRPRTTADVPAKAIPANNDMADSPAMDL